jgi:hypothetical protein
VLTLRGKDGHLSHRALQFEPRRTLAVKVANKIIDLLPSMQRDEEQLLRHLDLKRLPQHIAIIMDGNGRWAQRRHLPRVAGHRAGVTSARSIIETCARLNISALTLYAFSLEGGDRFFDAPAARVPPQRATDHP